MNTSQLLEIAQKVYVNRDLEDRRERDRRMKEKAKLLAVAITERNTGNGQRQPPP